MNVTINGQMNGAGVVISNVVSRESDSVSALEPTLPKGKDVTSWVKTDADTAACNLPAGHGYTNGNFDVFWTEGGVAKRRYKVPGTIATNALSLDGGSGDAFPASATTGIVVTKQVQVNVAIDGDALTALGLNLRISGSTSGGRGQASFYDASDNLIAHVDLPVPAYDIAGGGSNPFTGAPITYALASNASSAADATFQIIIGQDATP